MIMRLLEVRGQLRRTRRASIATARFLVLADLLVKGGSQAAGQAGVDRVTVERMDEAIAGRRHFPRCRPNADGLDELMTPDQPVTPGLDLLCRRSERRRNLQH